MVILEQVKDPRGGDTQRTATCLENAPMLSSLALLVACTTPPPAETADPGGTPPVTVTTPETPPPAETTTPPPPTTSTATGGSGAYLPPDPTTAPLDTAPPPDTGDTAAPVLDATGVWLGQCQFYGYAAPFELDLVDTAGVITGAGELHVAGYPVYPFAIYSGSRVYDAVQLSGVLSDPAHGYAAPTAFNGVISGNTLDGNLVVSQGGGAPLALPCTTTR